MTRARLRAVRTPADVSCPGCIPPRHEPEKLQHDDQRTRRRLRQREPRDGLLCRHPAQRFDEMRRDVAEHGIGTAERDQRRLREKDIHRAPRANPTPERCPQQQQRRSPQGSPTPSVRRV